jgi:hypothetical protein
MLIVAIAFAVVFLFRDIQVLTVQDRKLLAIRFGSYLVMLLIGLGVFAGATGSLLGWTERRFAPWAIAAQITELAISVVLQRYALGRHSWLGYILPSPALLAALCALGFQIQNMFLDVGSTSAMEIVAVTWLAIVGTSASVLCWMKNPWEDRRFTSDFAMMTSCTVVIFVPLGLA